MIAGGYVLSTLWGWFIVPIFEGMPTITIVEAIGISMFWGALNNTHIKSAIEMAKKGKEEGDNKDILLFFTIILMPWLVLLCGFILKHFFM